MVFNNDIYHQITPKTVGGCVPETGNLLEKLVLIDLAFSDVGGKAVF